MLLVIIVVIGIAAVVGSVHFSGGTITAKIENDKTALDRFADDFPEERVARTVLSADHQTAFLFLGSGLIGIVHSIGDRYLTRLLTAGEIKSAERTQKQGVSIILRDVTWRGGEFEFQNADDANALFDALNQVRGLG